MNMNVLTWFNLAPVRVRNISRRSVLTQPLVFPCVFNVLQANPEILRFFADVLPQ